MPKSLESFTLKDSYCCLKLRRGLLCVIPFRWSLNVDQSGSQIDFMTRTALAHSLCRDGTCSVEVAKLGKDGKKQMEMVVDGSRELNNLVESRRGVKVKKKR